MKHVIVVFFFIGSIANAQIKALSNTYEDPTLPNLNKNPIKTSPISETAIYSEIVAEYLKLKAQIDYQKKLSPNNVTELSQMNKRVLYYGEILHKSFISNGWTPVEKLEDANLIFHYRAISCPGDGRDCI